ncbi:MAG TPA: flagellar hook-length control protein FliK, partial [Xanthobacteraceae bacterium]|nr:flagellar hook-length control protein FliK [Xanthobacteraceae bacterium]
SNGSIVPSSTSSNTTAVAPNVSAPLSPAAAVALNEAVRVAAAHQGGLAPLFANVEQLAAGNAALPDPVRRAAQLLLSFRVPADKPEQITPDTLKQALSRSGLFMESSLAATAQAASVPQAASAPDLKSALLIFREVIKLWGGGANTAAGSGLPNLAASPSVVPAGLPALEEALGPASLNPPEEISVSEQPLNPGTAPNIEAPKTNAAPPPPPPYRGAPTAAQHAVPPSIPPSSSPDEAAPKLVAQVDAALSHHTLLQAASLSSQPASGSRSDVHGPQWTFEIPIMTQQGTSIAQFEISRDGRAATQSEGGPIWRARFSVDIEPMGPIHAYVALLGERTAVTLWAERPESVQRLRDNTSALTQALREVALDPGDIQFRTGAPAMPPKAAPAGRFLDQAS